MICDDVAVEQSRDLKLILISLYWAFDLEEEDWCVPGIGRQGRVSLGIRKTEQGQRWGGVVEYLLNRI